VENASKKVAGTASFFVVPASEVIGAFFLRIPILDRYLPMGSSSTSRRFYGAFPPPRAATVR